MPQMIGYHPRCYRNKVDNKGIIQVGNRDIF